jgi:sugar lactone lactonase YvrE
MSGSATRIIPARQVAQTRARAPSLSTARDGQTVVNSYSVPGHSDGLRWDPVGKKIWATSNEDANPALYSIDPTQAGASAVTTYTLKFADGTSNPPHGGGLDDLWFFDGVLFVVGSNPAMPDGVHNGPCLYTATISGTTATFAIALMGNASGVTDVASGSSAYTLNVIDPDSLSVDSSGNLVLIDQAGTELLVISHPGTASQAVTRYATGSQLDDTVWVPSGASGALLVADASKNTIWKVTGPFTAGDIFTELPNDSGVIGVVGTLDVTAADVVNYGYATVAPAVIGFGKPTGLYFLAQ